MVIKSRGPIKVYPGTLIAEPREGENREAERAVQESLNGEEKLGRELRTRREHRRAKTQTGRKNW